MANMKQDLTANKASLVEFDPVLLPDRLSRRQRRPSLIVRPTSKSLIVPATSRDHPEWLPLTNLDRVVNPTFISVICFYENVLWNKRSEAHSFNTVTASLKESLAKVLVDFYPLAGRLALQVDTGIVDLHCNDAGAIFIEASVNMSLAELGGPQTMPDLSGMDFIHLDAAAGVAAGKVYIPDQIHPAIPALVVQVTRFTCGSVALAANWHHTVADGFSGCHFMRSWAEVSSGREPTLQPCHDRQLLKPRNPRDSSKVSNGHYKSESSSQRLEAKVPRHQEDSSTYSTAAAVLIPAVVKPFLLRVDTVQELKEHIQYEAESSSGGSSDGQQQLPFTSVESMSAGLWLLMMRAKSIDSDDSRREERSRFFMFVDGRKTLGLPAGYFGNVVCSACAESTVGKILSKPLSYTASLIRAAKRSIDGEYFRSLIDWVEELGVTATASTSSDHVNSRGYDVGATFWNVFPLYQINFGWGKPLLSVRNAPPRNFIDGISMMPGPHGSGNLVALLNLRADHMQNLENDQQFSSAFRPLDMMSGSITPSSTWSSNETQPKLQLVACL